MPRRDKARSKKGGFPDRKTGHEEPPKVTGLKKPILRYAPARGMATDPTFLA